MLKGRQRPALPSINGRIGRMQSDVFDLDALAVRVAELVAAKLTAPLPAAMSDTNAAKYIGISRRQLWKLAATDGPKPVRIGRRALWRREDLDQYLATIEGGS
jgi:excisionase family DNA binding protein